MPDFFRRKKEKVLLRFGPADMKVIEVGRGEQGILIPELMNNWSVPSLTFLSWSYRRTKYKDKKITIFVCIGPEWDEEIFDA